MKMTTNALVCLVVPIICSCQKALPEVIDHDLGQFLAGQPINAEIPITNPFPDSTLITGTSTTCGFRVVGITNSILAPNTTEKLVITANSSRIPGESAFKLDLVLSSGKSKRAYTHLFRYQVKSIPVLTRTQVWTGQETNGLQVLGLAESQSIEVDTPSGVVAKIDGSNISFEADGPVSKVFSCNVKVIQDTAVIQEQPVDVIVGLKPVEARIYPTLVWLTNDQSEIHLFDFGEAVRATVAPSESVAVKLMHNRAFIKRKGQFSGKARIEFIDASGKTVICEVVVMNE